MLSEVSGHDCIRLCADYEVSVMMLLKIKSAAGYLCLRCLVPDECMILAKSG